MKLFRRLALTSGTAVTVWIAMMAVAMAAGSGGGPLPGSYHFTSTGANAFFNAPVPVGQPPGAGAFVSVFRGMTSFQPEDSRGSDGSSDVRPATTVNLQFSSPSGGTFGCFILSRDADFKVSRDLHSASLHTTLYSTDQCKGPTKALGGTGMTPLAGGGGGGLSFPIVIDVAWNWKGAVGTSRTTNQFECGNYSTDTHDVSRSAGANAIGTIKMADTVVLSGSSAATGGLQSSDTHLDVSGIPNPACFGF